MGKTTMTIPNDTLLKENIQKNLSFYRRRAKKTQRELADAIGSAAATVSGWERGASPPDINTLCAIYNFLDVNLYDMCGIIEMNMNLSAEENDLLTIFKMLDNHGRQKLMERAGELRDLGYISHRWDNMEHGD